MSSTLRVALAGNPNSGKSTIFNALTGSRQHIGNYPGVTVARKEGACRCGDTELRITDLPGTYSLTAHSQDEIVARDFLVTEEPDVVVAIVDAVNLERNLYLVTQLIELGAVPVIALNKWDLARARGQQVNVAMLSELLGVPIVTTVGTERRGLDELCAAAVEAAGSTPPVLKGRIPRYGTEVEPHVEELTRRVREAGLPERHARWFALKLLEGDEHTRRRLEELASDDVEALCARAEQLRTHVRDMCGDEPEIILADRRYGFISGACTEAVQLTVEIRHERSDRIDAVLINRWVGLPIFALVMFVLFQLTFAIGNPLVDLLDGARGQLADAVHAWGGEGNLLTDLLADGIIEGVGAVIVFVPLIVLLYIGISVLEDSGYMARAAFVLDRLMHRVGLHGKSVLPMLVGFGCTVPAVMATRILENRRDRLTTILVLPLMSCGARLPVYVLIIGAFFGNRVMFRVLGMEVRAQGLILFAIYALGILLAMGATKVFRSTLLRGESTSFVMELPPYRLPAAKGVTAHVGERTWEYLKKAGTIIFAISIVLWAMKTFPQLPDQKRAEFDQARQAAARELTAPAPDAEPGVRADLSARLKEIRLAERRAALEHSAIGRIGQTVAPVFRPAGLDWKITTALLGSFAAKEVFIAQMGVIYGVEDIETGDSLRAKLRADYTVWVGVSILLFILVSSPCAGTVAVTVRESESWRWAALQWGYLTVMAWVLATLTYQFGQLLT